MPLNSRRFQSPMGIVSSAKYETWYNGALATGFQSPMGIVSSAKRMILESIIIVDIVSIPDGDSFLREVDDLTRPSEALICFNPRWG